MPYLVCDDTDEDVNKYEVDIDGIATQTPAINGEIPGSKHMYFNITSVSIGSHIAKARAGNLWGWSGWTPDYHFTKSLPSVPSGIGLEEG